jgi:RimJ/RimL family protein N-acetyltransferase
MQRRIETARLVLHPVRSDEVTELHTFLVHKDVRRYLTDGVAVSREWVDGLIRDSDAAFAARGLGLWAARERGQSPIIGLTGFRDFYSPPVLELLYALRSSHWHRGFATEMARAVIDYAFTHGGLTEIRASTDEPNQASICVMERLGMRPYGRTSVADSELICWDQLHFVLSRADWQSDH